MDPITVAANAFRAELARAEAAAPGRPVLLVASATDRGDLVKTLRLVEWSAENRRPLFLHEAPFDGPDPWFAALCAKVRDDWDALRAGAADEGVTLAPLDPSPQTEALAPAARAAAYLDLAARRLEGRLDGVIIALCPRQIGDATAWRGVVEAWLRAPLAPTVHRWVHDAPGGPLDALFAPERRARFAVDPAALMDYLAGLDGAKPSAGPALPPPPALSPAQRAAVEAQTGSRVPSPEVGRALRAFLMGGAVALQRKDFATAAGQFGEARALCRAHAMPAEEAATLVALASLALASGARDRALACYQEAIGVSRDAGLHAVTCQAWMGVAGTLLSDGRHGDAAAAYARAADAAREGAVPLMRVEALRLAGTCLVVAGDERGAMRAWQTAVDEGTAEPPAARAAGTLRQTGEALAELLARHGLSAQAAHVRAITTPAEARDA